MAWNLAMDMKNSKKRFNKHMGQKRKAYQTVSHLRMESTQAGG